MKIIEPSAKLVRGYEDKPEELIELCGRICYGSQDKIAPGTAQKFCAKLGENGHTSVFEHANFIFEVPVSTYAKVAGASGIYEVRTGKNAYIRKTPCTYVSGNARAWLDIIETLDDINLACRIPQGILDVLNKHESIFADIVDVEGAANCFARQVFPEELPENVRERHTTATFLITCDRGISHELVRHRAASFSQQSTRYCKANKNGEIEVIKPSELKIPDEDFMKSVSDVDEYYEGLTECAKIPPQTARYVLPTCLATKLYMTMTLERWRDFLKLRTSTAAHPDMRVIAKQIQRQLFPDEIGGGNAD